VINVILYPVFLQYYIIYILIYYMTVNLYMQSPPDDDVSEIERSSFTVASI